MGTLLDAVCAKFPLAQICVTGYYQLLSQESLDSAGLALTIAFLNALNVFLGIASDLIRGDVFEWGKIMAANLLASLPPILIYAFLMDYYIAGLTAGATKG